MGVCKVNLEINWGFSSKKFENHQSKGYEKEKCLVDFHKLEAFQP